MVNKWLNQRAEERKLAERQDSVVRGDFIPLPEELANLPKTRVLFGKKGVARYGPEVSSQCMAIRVKSNYPSVLKSVHSVIAIANANKVIISWNIEESTFNNSNDKCIVVRWRAKVAENAKLINQLTEACGKDDCDYV